MMNADLQSSDPTYPHISGMSLGELPEFMIRSENGDVTYLYNNMRFDLLIKKTHKVSITVNTEDQMPYFIVSNEKSTTKEKSLNVAAAMAKTLTEMKVDHDIISDINELMYSPWMWSGVRQHLRKNRIVQTPSTRMTIHQRSDSPKLISWECGKSPVMYTRFLGDQHYYVAKDMRFVMEIDGLRINMESDVTVKNAVHACTFRAAFDRGNWGKWSRFPEDVVRALIPDVKVDTFMCMPNMWPGNVEQMKRIFPEIKNTQPAPMSINTSTTWSSAGSVFEN